MATLNDTTDRFTEANQYGVAAAGGTGAGTPSDTVVAETAFGQAEAQGTSDEYSRGDHTHGTPDLPTLGDLGAAATSHTHAESDVTNLVTDLAAKITQDGNARLAIAKAGSTVGTRRKLNFIEGANITFVVADDVPGEKVDVTVTAAGAGGVVDGDKGDVIVSGGGAVWTLDNTAVIPGSYGGSANSNTIQVDSKGRITQVLDNDIYVNISTGTHGTLQLGRGGTGATTAADARANLGAAAASHSHAEGEVTNLTADLAAKKNDSMATNKLLGRGTAGTGVIEEITLGSNITLSGTTLNVSSGTATLGDGDYGDVVVSGTGTVMSVDAKAISYAKMQDVSATDKLLGRASSGAGVVEEIACTAAGRALLDDASAADQRTTLGAAAASHSHATTDITNLTSGTYTPTLTAVLNVAATSAPSGYYMRIGPVVHVAGYFQMDPTTGSTLTKVGISLPVSSTLGAASNCSGWGNRDTGGATMNFGRIVGDAANNRAEWQVTIDADAANRDTYFSFTYRVI